MAYADLGKLVKQKYAGQYDDLPDEVLGQKVATKYPGQYDDIVGGTGAPAAPKPAAPAPTNKSFIEKVANFTGVSGFGNGIAQATGNLLHGGQIQKQQNAGLDSNNQLQAAVDKLRLQYPVGSRPPEITQKIQKLINMKGNPFSENDLQQVVAGPEGYVSNKQVIGGAVNAVLAPVTAGIPGAGSLIGRVGQGVALGAASGAATAANENKSAADIGTSAIGGGAVGGLLPALTELLTSGGKKLLNKGAESAYNKVVKTPAADKINGRELIGTGLMKRGVSGNVEDMIQKVAELRQNAGTQIGDVIQKNAGTEIPTAGANDALKELLNRLVNTPGENAAPASRVADEFSGILEKGGGKLNAADAQLLKQNLDTAVGNSGYNTTGQLPSGTEAQKRLANALRDAISTAVPDIAKPNADYGFARRAGRQLLRQSGQPGNGLGNRADSLLGLFGILNNDPKLLAAGAVDKFIRNPKVVTKAAQGAYKLGNKKLSPELSALLERILSNRAGASVANGAGNTAGQ